MAAERAVVGLEAVMVGVVRVAEVMAVALGEEMVVVARAVVAMEL